MNMNESFNSFDDLDQFQLEEATQIPNKDDITVLSCRGMCLKESGRNACPCKTIGQYCTSACHADSDITCMNSKEYLVSDSSEQSRGSEFIWELSVSSF
jgi:hypothetical protein